MCLSGRLSLDAGVTREMKMAQEASRKSQGDRDSFKTRQRRRGAKCKFAIRLSSQLVVQSSTRALHGPCRAGGVVTRRLPRASRLPTTLCLLARSLVSQAARTAGWSHPQCCPLLSRVCFDCVCVCAWPLLPCSHMMRIRMLR